MVRSLLVSLVFWLAASHVHAAETYPTRPIRLTVPSGAGGVTDILARILAERMRATPEEFAKILRADVAKWADVLKRAGIQPD